MIGWKIIQKVKTKIQRNFLDPDQRAIILEESLRQFGKKLDAESLEYPSARQEAFALLDQLSYEYETHQLDISEIYQKAYEQHPHNVRLLKTIVGLLRARDAVDKEAMIYYRTLSDLEPGNLQLLSLLVEYYKKIQDLIPLMMIYDRIIKEYRQEDEQYQKGEIEPGPDWDNVRLLYTNTLQHLGEIYANMGKTDQEAISIYRELLNQDDINLTVLKSLTHYYLDNQRTDPEATQVYEIYIAYDPTNKDLMRLLAKGYMAAAREQEGINIFKNLVLENLDDEESLNFLMEYYLKNNLLNRETLPYYKAYYEKHTSDRTLLARLVRYHADQSSLSEEAIPLIEKYLGQVQENSSEGIEFARNLGQYHCNNKNWAKVIEIYENILRLDPSSKDVLLPLATAYSEYDRTDEQALKIYQEAIQQGSRNEKIHNLLCQYLLESEKKGPSVVKIFKDTLSLHPRNMYARLGLCHYYQHVCEYQNGFNEAIRYLRFYPEDPKGIDCAAACLSQIDTQQSINQLSDLEERIRVRILEESLQKNPKVQQIILALSEIYQKTNRMDAQAEKVYLASIPYNRDNLTLLNLLSQYYRRQGEDQRAFHYDLEIFNSVKSKCPIYNSSKTKDSLPKECPKICARLARYILTFNIKYPDARNIFRCAYLEGESSPKLIRKLASLLLEVQDSSPEALKIYQELLAIDPENQEARKMVLRSQVQKGTVEPLLRFCEERLKTNPEDQGALDLLINGLSSEKITEERITYFLEKMYRRYPNNQKICLALALLYAHQENYGIATLGVYHNALKSRPDDLQILSGLARSYETAGNLDYAAEIYEQILGLIPDDHIILTRLATIYMNLGLENPQVKKVLELAIEKGVADIDLSLHLASFYFKNGEIHLGIENLDRLLRAQPQSLDAVITHLENLRKEPFWKPEMNIKLGYLYIEKEFYEEAINQFSLVSTGYPQFYGDLVEGYDRIIQKEPNYLRAHIERGVIHKILGNFEEAVSDLETSQTLAASNPNVLYELAECYAAYIANTRDPSTEILSKLGHLYYELEEYKKCIETYQQILKKDRKSRESILQIGKAFYKSNELDLALQYFIRLELTDEVKELLYELGDQFYQKGKMDRAIEAFNQILAVDISYRDVAMKINELRDEMKEGAGIGRQQDQILEQLGAQARQRFELLEEVGRGTMGTVFKTYDKQLDEIVALKVLSERFSEDEDAQERFRLEVKSARRLSHPNVVRIHDLGEEGGRKYISMEYVDGGDLKKLLIAQKRLSASQVIEFTLQIASGLAAAHQLGIIHRDIKPANILLTSDKVCKITDFGIATILKDAQNFSSDVIVGTPLYMSPEQNEGKHLEPSSDIYSLGVVIYEMLTGSAPFKIGNIAYHHIFTKPPEMKGIDKPLRDLVMKCLEKKPSSRFSTMEEIAALLESLKK